MGSADGDGDGDADDAASSCSSLFPKCFVVPKDSQQPVYLAVSEACGYSKGEDEDVVEEERGRMSAKQDESGNWILQWNVKKQKEGDFLGLCFVGEFTCVISSSLVAERVFITYPTYSAAFRYLAKYSASSLILSITTLRRRTSASVGG